MAVATQEWTKEDIIKIASDVINNAEIEVPDEQIHSVVDKHLGKDSKALQNAVGEVWNGQISPKLKDMLIKDRTETTNALAEALKKGIEETEAKVETHLQNAEADITKNLLQNFKPPTVDKAEVRRVADETAREILIETTRKAAQSGDVTMAMLPPLRTVCQFYVETDSDTNNTSKRAAYAIKARRHLLTSGPSGSGKTYPIEQELRKAGIRYFKVSVERDMAASDLVAQPAVEATKNGAETRWVLGPLPIAMQHGCALILDEVDQAQPEVLSVLNAVLEYRELYIPKTGETVIAKAGFMVFMTCNTLRDNTGTYSGFRLSAALLNRLVFAKADYLSPREEIDILLKTGCGKAVCEKLVSLFSAMRKAYMAGSITHAPSTRIAVRVANMIAGKDDDGNDIGVKLSSRAAIDMSMLDGLTDQELAVIQPLVQQVGL